MNKPSIGSVQPFVESSPRATNVTKLFDENERLAELRSLGILDTPVDKSFDRYMHMMAANFKVPMVAVSLIDENRRWFKSSVGFDVRETSLEDAFCVHALEKDFLEIPDTLEDDFFRHHPVVVGPPFLRFYMGTVLRGPTGQPLGTLCIMDTHSRHLTQDQRSWLVSFGHLTEELIDYHHALTAALQQVNQLQNEEREKLAAELVIANKELIFQSEEKEKRAAELVIANKELIFQSEEKEKRAAELVLANKELIFQSGEKEKRAIELVIANKKLTVQSEEKEKLAAKLVIANKELTFQSEEKEKRFAQLVIANKELTFQSGEKEKWAAELNNLAFYDTLTELPNRRLLLDRLRLALATSHRSGRDGALMFIDLDKFKDINDTLGHDFGDLLLQQVAQRLASCMRKNDTVARLGGDEFVVMLGDLSQQPLEAAVQVKAIGDKILATTNQPYLLSTHYYHSTVSIGATLFNDNDDNVSAEILLKRADIAMYQAKKVARNDLIFFNSKMQDEINARTSLEGDLRNALDNQEFQLYYQIQMDSSHRPFGVEALIRFLHPARGLVSPAQFIPLAEESGLILPIGKWVLETACAQLKIWGKDALTRDLILAVNISAVQFHQDGFVEQVNSLIQSHAIDPTRLKLEITESLLLKDVNQAISIMSRLKEIGVRFSLDDFGSGYSSLQYLKLLPITELKIDQSFIRDIDTDSSDKAIVHAIIGLANSLDLGVIAEGVETEDQRQCLLDRGCTHYQGYLFGKPVPLEQFEALLRQGDMGNEP